MSGREQEDVLRDKDHVTRNGRGLQIWSDLSGDPDAARDGIHGGAGGGGMGYVGTVERAGHIGRMARDRKELP